MTQPRSGRADDDNAAAVEPTADTHRVNWSRVLVYGLLPGLALLLAMAAGLLKWHDSSIRYADIPRSQFIQTARDSAIALLSFRSDTIEKDVAAARDRLTGGFCDTYTTVTREVLIPNAEARPCRRSPAFPRWRRYQRPRITRWSGVRRPDGDDR